MMESFGVKEKILEPASGEEKVLGREEKLRETEMNVKNMFDEKMEAMGTIRRIQENPSFGSLEDRNF